MKLLMDANAGGVKDQLKMVSMEVCTGRNEVLILRDCHDPM